MGISCSTVGKNAKFIVNVSLSEKNLEERCVFEDVIVNSSVMLIFALK